ncbi:3-deoxy-D-arabino-heptulosonate 7-phosphate synthase [bacterium]|nr:3-deoxy-D-arabino-heptulosonate 7-phosphate synthase [bacterium]
MIIEIEKGFDETVVQIQEMVKSRDCRPDVLLGDLYTVIAVEGDATQLDAQYIETLPGVVRTWRISSPYKTISRRVVGDNHQKVVRERRSVNVPGPDGKIRRFCDGNFVFIAGPCAIESREQMEGISGQLSILADRYGIRDRLMLRGGAYKPRTRPWDFRGLGSEGLDIIERIRDRFGFPVVTEAMAVDQIESIGRKADMIQIGTRNFQNFNLLEAAGQSGKPILYKRGISAELEEWLSAAEYIALQGNKDVVLCERGVKSTTHGDYNRSHIDLDVILAIRNRTILPVVVDPSHSSGFAELVPYQFCAASVYPSNGAMVEVILDETERRSIRCDARQAVRMSVFEKMIRFRLDIEKIPQSFDSTE